MSTTLLAARIAAAPIVADDPVIMLVAILYFHLLCYWIVPGRVPQNESLEGPEAIISSKILSSSV
jgi:hypothetical protein